MTCTLLYMHVYTVFRAFADGLATAKIRSESLNVRTIRVVSTRTQRWREN